MLSFPPGEKIGKYEIVKKLGQGGFGVVFLAHDTSLDREVALKFLNPEHTTSTQILQRFLQEARSAAKISHPGIVTVFECGESHGTAYIAMEKLEGESLTDRLARSGRLAPDSAMEIGRQVANALEAAHRAGIVHRDLKPDNIFLVNDPAVVTGERVKVLDFGIAKLGRSGRSPSLASVETHSMMVFGTPRYMSPEQCKSAAHVDHRSDIYTLGCILFELVTGRAPFDGAPGELIAHHVLVAAPEVATIVPEVPPHLARLIARMLAKEPDDRPQTMAHVQRELESSGAMSPGLAPTLGPSELAPFPRAPSVAPVSLGVRPGSQGVAASVARANPTTLAEASGSKIVAQPRRSRAGGIAAIGALVVAVGVGAWWLGARSHGEDTKIAAKAEPVEAAPPKPVEAPKPKPEPEPELHVAIEPSGWVQVTAQPACDIVVDDKPTSKHTPDKLQLAIGHHTITLVNKAAGVKDVLAVDVKDGATQTIARDYRPKQAPRQPPKQQPKAEPPQTRDGTVNPFAN